MDPYGTYIETLYYKVITPDRYKYEAPPPVDFETHEGKFELANGELKITLKQDHANPAAARAAIKSVLDAWEALADLRYQPGEFRLKYQRYEQAYRNPPPPNTLIAGVGEMFLEGISLQLYATATVLPPVRRAYPPPPTGFVLSPDARTMSSRLLASLEGREPLPAAAYFCLTVIETLADQPSNPAVPKKTSGKRKQAAQALAIDLEILATLGELSSEYGASIGRKVTATKPLSAEQTQWLKEALRKLIVRVGEYSAGSPLTQLTMAQLPPL